MNGWVVTATKRIGPLILQVYQQTSCSGYYWRVWRRGFMSSDGLSLGPSAGDHQVADGGPGKFGEMKRAAEKAAREIWGE